MGVPHGHYKTNTVSAGLRSTGVVAVSLFDGAMNGERFRTYVDETQAPCLKPGDTVIPDNLSVHKVKGVIEPLV